MNKVIQDLSQSFSCGFDVTLLLQYSYSQTPIYHEIQDATEEELQQQRQLKVETTTTTDSFYELLQAVN